MDTIHYMLDNAGYLASLTFQHLWLVALAVGLAIIIGVPLGVLIVRHKWLATPYWAPPRYFLPFRLSRCLG